MYDLIEYSNNYSKITGSLWQYHRDEPFSDAKDTLADFSADNDNNSASFKFETKIVSRTEDDRTKTVKIMVPFTFWVIFGELVKCH